MKNILLKGLGLIVVAGLISCASETVRPKMTYYHGQKPPDAYFTMVGYTAGEIEFKIRVDFAAKHMYHLILEGDKPLAEGWYPTNLGAEEFYKVKIQAKKGLIFQPGKTYRLCIGAESPELVAEYRNTYKCIVDYEFVLPKK